MSWSGPEPGPEPAAEALWEQELARLCASRVPLRALPYAMVDKRLIRRLREPQGVKTSRWRQWQRRRRRAARRLGEAARRLSRGFGLWEGALYEIGGLFGTGVQAYFTFLRFLLLLNLLTLLVTASFVLLPLAWLHPPDPGPALNLTLQCPSGHQHHTGLPRFHNQFWNVLSGRAFNNTYLFYGAYRAGPERHSAYSIRLAYLLSPLACLLLCFCGTLQRMVKGLPQRPVLTRNYRAPLSAKVFSSWDFCIRVWEAAAIKKHEISNEFKVELEEGHSFLLAQQQSRAQRAVRLLTHVRVNLLFGLLVVGAISTIFWATKYSQDNKEEPLFVLLQYLPPGVMALVNFLGPQLFVSLAQLENFPPNTEVNLTLIWCVVLKLASLGMFSFSLGQTVLCVGGNRTGCAARGYNACDYQVAGPAPPDPPEAPPPATQNPPPSPHLWENLRAALLPAAAHHQGAPPHQSAWRGLLLHGVLGELGGRGAVQAAALQLPAHRGLRLPGQPAPQAAGGAPLRPLLGLAGPGGVPGAQERAGHRGRADGHLDGPLLLPAAASAQQRLHLPHLLHQEVHAAEELQGPATAVPRLQHHLLLPAGAAPGPAAGRRAAGLRGQQRPLLLGLRPLHQLLGPLAGGPRAGGPAAAAPRPARPRLPQLPRLRLPPPYPAQHRPHRVRVPGPGQREGHPHAPEAAGAAGAGEMAPGGGPVATAAGAKPERGSGPRVPSLQSFAPTVLPPRISVPRLPRSQPPWT